MVYPKSPSAKATNKAAVWADKEARTRQAFNRQLSIVNLPKASHHERTKRGHPELAAELLDVPLSVALSHRVLRDNGAHNLPDNSKRSAPVGRSGSCAG
jgi:hypothetical protein